MDYWNQDDRTDSARVYKLEYQQRPIYRLPDAPSGLNGEGRLLSVKCKWRTIIDKLKMGYTLTNIGLDSCTFCIRYNKIIDYKDGIPHWNDCEGCPIKKITSGAYCNNTPLEDFNRALNENDYDRALVEAEKMLALIESIELEKPKETTKLKLRVFDSTKILDEQTPIYLKLEQNLDGSITVNACDQNGNRYTMGSLITFYIDGTVYRHYCVKNNLGFKLDEDERIEFKDELDV